MWHTRGRGHERLAKMKTKHHTFRMIHTSPSRQLRRKKLPTDIKINQFLKTNEGNNNSEKKTEKYKIETSTRKKCQKKYIWNIFIEMRIYGLEHWTGQMLNENELSEWTKKLLLMTVTKVFRSSFLCNYRRHSLTHTHTPHTHLSAPINSTIKHNSWNVHTAHDSVAASPPSLRLYRLQKNVSRVRRANTKRIRLALDCTGARTRIQRSFIQWENNNKKWENKRKKTKCYDLEIYSLNSKKEIESQKPTWKYIIIEKKERKNFAIKKATA